MLKSDSDTIVFLMIFAELLRASFLQNTTGGCSCFLKLEIGFENLSRRFTKFTMLRHYLTLPALHDLLEVKTVGDSGFMNDRIALVSHLSSLVCTRFSFVFDSSLLVCTGLSFVFTRLHSSFICMYLSCHSSVILVVTY